MDGHGVMLVMFGRPDNARGDASFFTMLDPFAYLSATQGLDKQPLEYAAGDKFSLSYLLTVYAENKSAEFIQRRCELWEKERSDCPVPTVGRHVRAWPAGDCEHTPSITPSTYSNTPLLHSL